MKAERGGGLEVQWSTSRPGRFIAWKETRYLLNGRLGGPLIMSGRFGKGKFPVLVGIRTPDIPVHRLVSIMTTLSRLTRKKEIKQYIAK
jgi:hypothetical protein